MGNSNINHHFSIAMLNYQRVYMCESYFYHLIPYYTILYTYIPYIYTILYTILYHLIPGGWCNNHLEKMMEFVNGKGYSIPYMEWKIKHVWKPPTRYHLIPSYTVYIMQKWYIHLLVAGTPSEIIQAPLRNHWVFRTKWSRVLAHRTWVFPGNPLGFMRFPKSLLMIMI